MCTNIKRGKTKMYVYYLTYRSIKKSELTLVWCCFIMFISVKRQFLSSSINLEYILKRKYDFSRF